MAAGARQVKKPRGRVPTRAPRGVERHMDAEQMHTLYDSAGPSLSHGTKTERLIMAAHLASAVAGARSPMAAFNVSLPSEELQRALAERLTRYVLAGGRQLAAELERQAATGGTHLAEPRKPRRQTVTPAAQAAVAGVALAMALQIESEMRGQAALLAAQAATRQAALGKAALEQALTDSSEDALLRVRFAVHDLVALGRAEEAKANADRIANAVYSSLLDGNSCDDCAAMDGQETTDLDEAAAWTPNGSCAGGARCRCVTVYELAQ